jgi:hypothetical protein
LIPFDLLTLLSRSNSFIHPLFSFDFSFDNLAPAFCPLLHPLSLFKPLGRLPFQALQHFWHIFT